MNNVATDAIRNDAALVERMLKIINDNFENLDSLKETLKEDLSRMDIRSINDYCAFKEFGCTLIGAMAALQLSCPDDFNVLMSLQKKNLARWENWLKSPLNLESTEGLS